MQTIYGIFLVYGYRQLAETTYLSLQEAYLCLTEWKCNHRPVITLLAAAVLFLLGLRFAWAVANIGRFVQRRGPTSKWHVTTTHFPILMGHAFSFYCLCRIHADIVLPNQDWTPIVTRFSACNVLFLMLNVAWLTILTRRVQPTSDDKVPEQAWIGINVRTAAGATVFLVILHAMSRWQTIWIWWQAVPLLIFLTGSVADLYYTASEYLVDPDVQPANNSLRIISGTNPKFRIQTNR
jgi:hypothetical protein